MRGEEEDSTPSVHKGSWKIGKERIIAKNQEAAVRSSRCIVGTARAKSRNDVSVEVPRPL